MRGLSCLPARPPGPPGAPPKLPRINTRSHDSLEYAERAHVILICQGADAAPMPYGRKRDHIPVRHGSHHVRCVRAHTATLATALPLLAWRTLHAHEGAGGGNKGTT